jgi:hypothetical protein
MALSMVVSSESNWSTAVASPSPKSTGSLTWQAGDLLVVLGGVGDETSTLDVPTYSGGTFTQRAATNNGSGDFCDCWLWTSTASSGGTGTIDGNKSAGASAWGMGLTVWRGHNGIGDITVDTSTAQTVPLDRTGSNSGAMFISLDWSAATATGTWAPSGQTVLEANDHGSSYAAFCAWWDSQGSPGTTAYGITTSSTGSFAKIGVEILEASSTAPNVIVSVIRPL